MKVWHIRESWEQPFRGNNAGTAYCGAYLTYSSKSTWVSVSGYTNYKPGPFEAAVFCAECATHPKLALKLLEMAEL